MIIFHEGSPGSGKTYDAVVKIIANLKKGRKVYTNVEGLDRPECREMMKCKTGLDDYQIDNQLNNLPEEKIKNFYDFVENGSMVVIDEIHKYFNSRDWQTQENRKVADWCSTHRHYGFDAIFITQRIEKCDSQVRTLTEWTYRYKKVNFLGSFVNKSYVCFAYSGDDTTQALTKKVSRYDPEIFACYKSYVSKDVKELKIQTHANILKHPVFMAIPVLLILTGYFLWKAVDAHSKGGFMGIKTAQQRVAEIQGKKPLSPEEEKKLIDEKMNEMTLQTPAVKTEPVTPETPVPAAASPTLNAPVAAATTNASVGMIEKKSEAVYAVINGKKIKYCEAGICVSGK